MRNGRSHQDRLANAAATIVILLAGALSTAWAFIVPIFQAPDEPAHFDYAISILTARRLITLADGRPDWIVSPYTRYLMRTTDFDRIAGHSSMRVPRGYGSRVYFARIDAQAPNESALSAPTGRISYIVHLYPFAFYALEALWMGFVSIFTRSIVSMFFCARLLCVFLMMAGLYFNYRAARNLGVPKWISVGLIAGIGFFPLVSLVGAYVQPDNLTYALLSASLFFATKLTRSNVRYSAIMGLGLSLGLLAVTKYHFFIAVAIPVAALFTVRSFTQHWPALKRVAAAALLIAPAFALLMIQYFVVNHWGQTARAPLQYDSSLAPVQNAVALGFIPMARYLFVNSAAAFTDYFIFGPCAATYWQTIGWVDTPIVFINAHVALLVRVGIALGTIAVVVVLTLSTCRNLARLFATSIKRHLRIGLVIATADPVFNSYICFVALMFGLYVITQNAFGAEGRHWYPYVFAAFLSLVWYAPRALSRNHLRLSALLTVGLCVYSATALAFAAGDLRQRYYGSPQDVFAVAPLTLDRIVPGSAPGALRPLQDAAYHVNGSSFPFSFVRGSRVSITGAVLPNARGPAKVAVLIDGGRLRVPVLSGQYDFRAAEFMHDVNDGYSGFSAELDTGSLALGAHTVTAYAAVGDGLSYERVAPTRLFFVTALDGRLPAPLVRRLASVSAISGSARISGACRGRVQTENGIGATDAGTIAVVRGTASRIASAPKNLAVWMMLDRLPFPAESDERGGFTGAIPTAGLAPGLYDLMIYAMPDSASVQYRVPTQAALRVVRSNDRGTLPLDWRDQLCADPQLASS